MFASIAPTPAVAPHVHSSPEMVWLCVEAGLSVPRLGLPPCVFSWVLPTVPAGQDLPGDGVEPDILFWAERLCLTLRGHQACDRTQTSAWPSRPP